MGRLCAQERITWLTRLTGQPGAGRAYDDEPANLKETCLVGFPRSFQEPISDPLSFACSALSRDTCFIKGVGRKSFSKTKRTRNLFSVRKYSRRFCLVRLEMNTCHFSFFFRKHVEFRCYLCRRSRDWNCPVVGLSSKGLQKPKRPASQSK